MMELHMYFPVCLHGAVLNYLSAGTTYIFKGFLSCLIITILSCIFDVETLTCCQLRFSCLLLYWSHAASVLLFMLGLFAYRPTN
jgi:hypothetical protein